MTLSTLSQLALQLLDEVYEAWYPNPLVRVSWSEADPQKREHMLRAVQELLDEDLLEANIGGGGDVYNAKLTARGRRWVGERRGHSMTDAEKRLRTELLDRLEKLSPNSSGGWQVPVDREEGNARLRVLQMLLDDGLVSASIGGHGDIYNAKLTAEGRKYVRSQRA